MELNRSSRESNELRNDSIQKFLSAYPRAFSDRHYLTLEREKKWHAHERWQGVLSLNEFKRLLTNREFEMAATRALGVENRTDFLEISEKMGLRDAIKNRDGAEIFAKSLYQFLYGTGPLEQRFQKWCEAFNQLPGIMSVGTAPRNKNRIVAWEVVSIFGFLAQPHIHAFLKPDIVLTAARNYGSPFNLDQRPSWAGYANYLRFCEIIKRDLKVLRPKDMIDVQSFIWIIGSEHH